VVRNGLEHMDEYLDAWVVQQPRATPEEIEASNWPKPPPTPQMPVRLIDSSTLQISFSGKTVDVGEVAEEAQRIADLIPGDMTVAPLLTLLRRLPRYPPELGFGAPTRRPDEPVTAGLPPTDRDGEMSV
jgi:hypothetical protein